MFTGIIEAVGSIKQLTAKGQDYLIEVNVNSLDMSDVKLGDSIAVNGTCLTVTSFSASTFSADVSSETIKRTKLGHLKAGSAVNLEKACTPNTRLGGHIVSGHVDGVGTVKDQTQSSQAYDYWISAPGQLAKFIAEKGSITVDGISLTVNEIKGDDFRLTIIPHTRNETCIVDWKTGSRVNLEVDMIARYVDRLLSYKGASQTAAEQDDNMMSLLAKSGFIK